MNDDEKAIRELISTWLTASQARDTEKVLSLMSDDVVFLMAGQPPMRGKAAFAKAQSGLQNIEIEASSNIQEIKVLGDWAYIWTELTVVMTPENGPPNKRAGYTLSMLHKQNGAWVIARDANMLAVVD
jgi:uncharacterized protein (TIGR02246 family)